VRYEQMSRTIRWEIGKLPKDKTPTLEGKPCLHMLLRGFGSRFLSLHAALVVAAHGSCLTDCCCAVTAAPVAGGIALPSDFIPDESPTVRAEFQASACLRIETVEPLMDVDAPVCVMAVPNACMRMWFIRRPARCLCCHAARR
jgi:hypothetical protein